jgi:hypothetical protein
MTINLTPQEAENHFYDAMCNGLGELSYYDLDLDFDKDQYNAAKNRLEKSKPNEAMCFEDVLMEMLRNGDKLWIVDMNDDEHHPITLELIHERVQNTPIRHLMDAINENGDATTADCIIQTVVYGEVIYG